jgi:hypothetical protein
MNKVISPTVAAIAVLLLATVAVLARDKNHHNVTFPETIQIGTSRLDPGEYTMEWSESGSTAQVTFLQHGKSVAQVPAKVVNLDHSAASDSVTMKAEAETLKLWKRFSSADIKKPFRSASQESDFPSAQERADARSFFLSFNRPYPASSLERSIRISRIAFSVQSIASSGVRQEMSMPRQSSLVKYPDRLKQNR